jgi:hypothetical protein
MTEPSVEEIVARFELVGFLSIMDIRALIASWRERGEALEDAREDLEGLAKAHSTATEITEKLMEERVRLLERLR